MRENSWRVEPAAVHTCTGRARRRQPHAYTISEIMSRPAAPRASYGLGASGAEVDETCGCVHIYVCIERRQACRNCHAISGARGYTRENPYEYEKLMLLDLPNLAEV